MKLTHSSRKPSHFLPFIPPSQNMQSHTAACRATEVHRVQSGIHILSSIMSDFVPPMSATLADGTSEILFH